MRGATTKTWQKDLLSPFQSTRPLRGATEIDDGDPIFRNISIHAPLAGRDDVSVWQGKIDWKFQSTRPLRGATQVYPVVQHGGPISIHAPLAGRDDFQDAAVLMADDISIHAPLAGRDFRALPSVALMVYFNPRAPCGARRTSGRRRQKA